jgi:hypothetical protein
MQNRIVRSKALAIAAGLLVSACEQPQLTAPVVPASAGVPRASVTEPVQLGSATLTAPSTGTVPVGSAPDSTWVMIHAAGQLKAVDSGACGHTPPNWPCTFPAPWTAYETAFPFTSGPVLITRQFATRSTDVPMRGLSADGEAVGLIPPDQAAEVLAQLVLNNPEAYNPNPPPTNPQAHPYIITGTYSVTATAIPVPLVLTGGRTGDSLGTVSYTVSPQSPFLFINPRGDPSWYPAGAPEWYFVPGDSVAPVWNRYESSDLIYDCWHLYTCTWTPPAGQNGRIEVHASVETWRARIRSDYVRLKACHFTPGPLGSRAARYSVSGTGCTQEPKLVLRCDGHTDADSVRRGNPVDCTVSVDPSTVALTNLKWQFQDDSLHTIPGPAGEAREWSGVMVVGGKMQVSATVQGSQLTAEVPVTVLPRNWVDKRVPLREVYQRCGRAAFGAACPLWYPPRVAHELAEGRAEPNRDWGVKARSVILQSGPNKGWAYIAGADAPIPFTEYLIHYSDLFQHPSDLWWQTRTDPDCQTAAGVQDLFNAASAHERLHYTMFDDVFGGPHDGKWNQRLEGFFRFGLTDLSDWQTATAIEALDIDTELQRLSGHNHDYPNTSVWAVYSICVPNF